MPNDSPIVADQANVPEAYSTQPTAPFWVICSDPLAATRSLTIERLEDETSLRARLSALVELQQDNVRHQCVVLHKDQLLPVEKNSVSYLRLSDGRRLELSLASLSETAPTIDPDGRLIALAF